MHRGHCLKLYLRRQASPMLHTLIMQASKKHRRIIYINSGVNTAIALEKDRTDVLRRHDKTPSQNDTTLCRADGARMAEHGVSLRAIFINNEFKSVRRHDLPGHASLTIPIRPHHLLHRHWQARRRDSDRGRQRSARSPYVEQRQKGFYAQPTVFTGVKESMRVYREEIFGPVVVIAIHAAEDEAVDAANNTTYGLSAAVFANDLERAHRVAAEIEVVMVWIKRHARLRSEDYVRWCEAQWGLEELGQAGLETCTQTEAVHVNMGMEL
jgi:hypothetical protein